MIRWDVPFILRKRRLISIQRIQIDPFLANEETPIVDVRAPIEFAQGHIPSAINIPLFSDQQRAEVGTIYKQQGRVAAVKKGLEFIGPRMNDLISQVEGVCGSNRCVRLHCARGGERSSSMAWLLDRVNFEIALLDGGYKRFRNFVLDSLADPGNLMVLSGLTGSGKTQILKVLKEQGEQVVDLEGLANHRGSAFGGIGLPEQPTVEQFENDLLFEFRKLDPHKRIWVEDECQSIGSVHLPIKFFRQLRAAPAIFLEIASEMRAKLILDEYGELPQKELVESIEKIRKRFGGQNVKAAVKSLESGDLVTSTKLVLEYYDRTYNNSKSKMTREVMPHLPLENPLSKDSIEKIVQLADEICKTESSKA